MAELTIQEIRNWMETLPGVSCFEGRSFVTINGNDYLLIDIENALIKGTKVRSIL